PAGGTAASRLRRTRLSGSATMEGMTTSADTPALDDAQRAQIIDRLDDVLARVDRAAERAGRDAAEITVLLATKLRSPQGIVVAEQGRQARGACVAGGVVCAEEIAKHAGARLGASGGPRHFIGRLQTNNARDVIAFAELVHSVDRPDIAEALERRAELADL